jgi:predicted phage replisome organizer
MSEIKWIKITTDIFDDEKIKLIEKLPEGDTMLVIWLKLLTLAGKRNDTGLIYLTRDIPFTSDMLSDVMQRDPKIVSLALNTFKSFGMIEIFDNFIQIINWEKHQNIEGMNKIKELNRLRQQRFRETKKKINSNVIVTLHNATDKTREDKIRLINIYKCFFDYWNNKKIQVHNDQMFNRKFKTKHKTIIDEYGKDEIDKAIDNYHTVFTGSEYYWSYKWSFFEFIEKGVDKFVSSASPLENYKKTSNNNKQESSLKEQYGELRMEDLMKPGDEDREVIVDDSDDVLPF